MAFIGNQVVTATGSISTQNLVAAGVATANSAVEISLTGGQTTLGIQVTGTYTGVLTLQATVNGTVWITLGGIPLLNVATGVYSGTIASATIGAFQADVAGFTKARITALVAVTGASTITLTAVQSAAMVALDAPLPTGSNTVGNVAIITTSMTPGTSAAHLGKAEDAAHASGDTGVMALGVQQNTPSSLGTAGDYEPFTLGPDGRLMADIAYGKSSTNGISILRSTTLTNSAVVVKASSGNLYGIHVINPHTAAIYIKFYNLASGAVVGTSPVIETFAVPAGITGNPGILLLTPDIQPILAGNIFTTGISVAATLNLVDNDTTAPPTLPVVTFKYV